MQPSTSLLSIISVSPYPYKTYAIHTPYTASDATLFSISAQCVPVDAE